MTIEYEAGRIPEVGLSEKFLNRVLRPERSLSLPTWEELPSDFELPENWVEIIRQLADKTIQNDRAVGIVGYLSRCRFLSQNIRFGKPVLGTENSIPLNAGRRKFPLSLFLPSDIPVIEIHTNQAVRLKEKLPSGLELWSNPGWQNPSQSNLVRILQIPSKADLARFLCSPETLLSFVVLPMNDGKTGKIDIDIDIDVLVKCHETDFLARAEDQQQLYSNFDVAIRRFAEKGDQEYGLHLVDWKIFFGTVARTYKVGYYSSYDCSSAAHQELSSGKPIHLIRVPSFDSLDAFLASPSLISARLK